MVRRMLRATCVIVSLAGLLQPARAEPAFTPSGELTDAERQELAKVRSLNAEVLSLMKAGKPQEASPLAIESIAICERVLGPDDAAVALCLNNLAEIYVAVADFAKAEPLHRRALAIREKELGPNHLHTATSLNNLAILHRSLGQSAKAEPLFVRALAIREKELGPAHPQTAQSLNNLAMLHHDQADYAAAEPLFVRALAIYEKVHGPDHLDTALALNNLALLYDAKADYARAEPLYIRSLAICEKSLGPEHPLTAAGVNNLGSLYYLQGAYAKAEPLLVRALAIKDKSMGLEHPDTATSAHNLAVLYRSMGDSARAEPLYVRALAIREQAFGPEHPSIADSLGAVAGLYMAMGDYVQAESLYKRALAIRKKTLPPEHPATAKTLNGLAMLYDDKGDYAQAEPHYTRALAIHEQSLGPNHPETALSLNNLAWFYRTRADYAKAEPLYVRALAIREQALGPEHPLTAESLNNLALLRYRLRDYARSEELFTRALAIQEKTLGPNHPKLAATLQNLAGQYQWLGDYAKAEPLLTRAVAIQEKSLGPDHLDTVKSRHNLAFFYNTIGEHAKAESLYQRVLAIREKILGADHPSTALCRDNLASVYAAQGNYAQAESLSRRALRATLDHLDNAALAQSERQQLLLAGSDQNKIDYYLNIALAAKDYDQSAYGFLLAWKGNVLTRQRMRLTAADDPRTAEKFAELQNITTRLSTLALQSPAPPQQAAWQRQIHDYSQAKERLERELSTASAAFRAARERATPAQIQAALPPDTALVDFIVYAEYGIKGRYERRVAAFVITKNEPVKLLDLAPIKQMREAIDIWRAGGFGTSADAQKAAALLRKSLWQPLESHLADAALVFVSPDGELGKLPLAALPGRKAGTYLIEDYALAVIPVPSVLAHPLGVPPDAEATTGLLAVGDVDYNRQEASLDTLVVDRSLSGTRAAVVDKSLHFAPLKGTGPEAIAVGRAFRAAFPDVRPVRLAGIKASEAAFRAAAPRYRYIHLATHGYFADASVQSALARDVHDQGASPAGLLSNQTLAGYHPDLLSGIAMAGANQPTEDGDDGILTAAEVQALDLRRVDLVGLSACETGLGQTAGGEGLLGLQRSFQAAGAKHVLASLWTVDDAATKTLMIEFYRNLWQERLGKAQALRRAQLTMLERYDPRRHELRPRGLTLLPNPSGEKVPPARLPPYYWAAFVLSGAGQ